VPALTTFDPLSLHQLLDTMASHHVQAVCLEASSHGLDQYRLDATPMTSCGFTNLTQDHLDYHLTMDAYFKAKARLFQDLLPEGGTAVYPIDSPYFGALEKISRQKNHLLFTYGIEKTPADFYIHQATPHENGYLLTGKMLDESFQDVFFPLQGTFNILNMLCAAAQVYGTLKNYASPSQRLKILIQTLHHLQSIKGRMEYLGSYRGGKIYVDYAHTPDALENILSHAKHGLRRKLFVVFGCVGNRDAKKRPLMGKIAALYADHVYITDDNPRFEDPQAIQKEILAGIDPQNHHKVMSIEDRREAIITALKKLSPDDVLIVAGKGHETGQSIQGITVPFSDQEVIQTFLNSV